MLTKIITSLLMLATFSAFSEEKKLINYRNINENCLAKAEHTENGFMQSAILSGCADATSSEAKKEINSLYKKIYSSLLNKSPESANKLEQAQKSWVTYRNNYCQLTGDYIGSPMYYICPMNLNILRVDELRELGDQFENN